MNLFSSKSKSLKNKEVRHERARHLGFAENRIPNLEEVYWRAPNSSQGKVARSHCDREKKDEICSTGL